MAFVVSIKMGLQDCMEIVRLQKRGTLSRNKVYNINDKGFKPQIQIDKNIQDLRGQLENKNRAHQGKAADLNELVEHRQDRYQ